MRGADVVNCLSARSPKQCAWMASVWWVSHCKNVKPNHSRGKLAAQGIQILFKSCPSVTDSVTEWELKSERPGIIRGQRGCHRFRFERLSFLVPQAVLRPLQCRSIVRCTRSVLRWFWCRSWAYLGREASIGYPTSKTYRKRLCTAVVRGDP